MKQPEALSLVLDMLDELTERTIANEAQLAPLKAANEALTARVAELEARPAPEKGEPGERGEDGSTPSLEAVWREFRPQAEEIILNAVSDAVEALPASERGEKGEPGERGEVGVGIAGAVIDREGCLVVTLSDGSTKGLGQVVARDAKSALSSAMASDFSDDEYAAKVQKLLSGDTPTAVEETGRESANDARPALTTDVLEHDDG